MFEMQGKYNSCKVFADTVDNETVSQINNFLNQESLSESKIRFMPDVHTGKGCAIGTTMTIVDKVIPNLVGVDIGCFTGDTEVYMSNGTYKSLRELYELGGTHTVCSYDIERKVFRNSNAVAKLTRRNADLVCVRYWIEWEAHTETEIKCTPDHKFLVKQESEEVWVDAKDLKRGMYLVNDENDNDIEVYRDTEVLCEKSDVYCLTVDETHTFDIMHGVVVHNCGVAVTQLKEKRIDLPKLDSIIRKNIPNGSCNSDFVMRGKAHSRTSELRLNELALLSKRGAKVKLDKALLSCGSLGGGNHFIEIDKDEDDNLYLLVHTGSRLLGMEICSYYQQKAYELYTEQDYKREYDRLLQNTPKKDLSKVLLDIRKQKSKYLRTDIPFELAYCEGDLLKDYLHDMQITQEFAALNRQIITDVILKEARLHGVDSFDTIHNYIDMTNMILRKGAISSQLGERMIIPINMRDGALICVGKGNPDWNYSAPHGAGRLMSRSEAKESISMTSYKESMKGIFSTSVSKSTIDESPMAYKSMDEIVKNIAETADIQKVIKPIYNFKAG